MSQHTAAQLAEAVENAKRLDPISEALNSVSQGLPQGARTLLTGEATGSPLHPALVHLPIGAAISTLVVEFLGGRTQAPAARLLAGLTAASAIPAALTGLADLGEHDDTGVRRLGAAHALANGVGTTLAAKAWLFGGGGSRTLPRLLMAGSVAAYLAAGFLGGHIVHEESATGPGAE